MESLECKGWHEQNDHLATARQVEERNRSESIMVQLMMTNSRRDGRLVREKL